MNSAPCKSKTGFTLVENLISLSVVAVMIPTALAAISLSLDTQRTAEQEERSVAIAEYVFNQLPYAWREERNFLFPGEAETFPAFSDAEELHLLFSDKLLPYDKSAPFSIGEEDWKLSSEAAAKPFLNSIEVSAGYVVTLRQEDISAPKYNTAFVRGFTLEVAHPAAAPAEQRKVYSYKRLFRK